MKKTTFFMAVLSFFLMNTAFSQITSYPYAENFDAGDGGWVADNTTNGSWALGAPTGTIINSAASGTDAWVTNLSGNYNTNEDAFVTSPVFDLSSLTNPTIEFSIWWNSEFSWDGLVLQSSIDGGTSWQNVGANGDPNNWFNDGTINANPGGQQDGWTGRNATGNGSGAWVTANHLLDGLGGQASVQLRFAFASDGSVQDEGVAFDSVSIFDVSCLTPGMQTATNIMQTTADLGWTENGTATSWDVEVIAAGGTPTGTPTATGVMNPYTATGLTANTAYDFYVRSICGGSTSAWAGPFSFVTACPPFIAAPYTEDFEAFTPVTDTAFAMGNCWTGTNTGASYYWESAPGTDAGSGGTGPDPSITTGNYFYTEASGSTAGDVAELVSPTVDLTALTAPALTFNYHMFGGEIGTLDVLVNGTDNVWTLTGQQQTSATALWELAVVDLAAYAGQQITVTFRATGAGSFEGDISVDNVSFTELPACPTPNALTATMITDTTADLGWTENGSATAWDIEIVDVTAGGMATGTPTATGVMNPYTAMGLTQNNDYAFYVRADCGGSTSTWAGPFAFSTLETCPAPTALTATNIMDTSADLGWTENGAATTWNIELVDVTAGGTATGTATATGVTNPYTAMGLTAENNYQYYVQADCGMDGVSAWAGPFAFTTPPPAPTCTSGSFSDSGGAANDYSSSENITYTICPDMAGDVVNVEFTFFSTENNGAAACWDGLTIHDGADATATTIDPPGGGTVWCWDEDDAPAVGTGDLEGMTITSSDASGCLTFVFTSDGSVTREGWQANITCAPLSVESAEVRGFLHYVDTANNSFVVNAQSNINSIEVYNLVGQVITVATPKSASGEANLGSASNGVYFARVTLENGRTSVVKFVK